MKVAILYGAPGAGKGTQANLLQDLAGFIHFDTGKYIEGVVHDLKNQNDPVIIKEKNNFDTGALCTPEWVLKIISEKTLKLSKTGFNLAFSGSPRTEFEMFGDAKNEGLMSILDRLYGKENIYVFFIQIPPKTSMERNSSRLVCSVCSRPVLAAAKINACPICGAPLRKRTLDNPKAIGVRLKEFNKRTFPIIKKLGSAGFKINKIDGKPAPYKVFSNILKKIS